MHSITAHSRERNSPPGDDIERRLRGLKCLVGNTPLLELDLEFKGERRTLYAKAEYINMTGSIKDRMALHIFQKAYTAGRLKPGDLIAEATSGNTGIAVAAVGRALGHPVTVFMPDWMSRERINLLRSLGSRIELVTKEEGGFIGSIERAEALAAENGHAFLPRQFSNQDNVEAHAVTTGPEIWWQMKFHGLKPDAFVAGVGTGGTIMGVGRYLRGVNPDIRLHPVEPANSPTLSTGHKSGKHRIQGISDEFIPPIVDLKAMDDVVGVDDGDAILMAQKLAGDLGLGVGISSGANVAAALEVQSRMGRDAVVVTVLPDDNKKYLSTDLLGEEPVKDGFLAPDVRFLGFHGFKRVCHTCCDPKECLDGQLEGSAELSLPACARRE